MRRALITLLFTLAACGGSKPPELPPPTTADKADAPVDVTSTNRPDGDAGARAR